MRCVGVGAQEYLSRLVACLICLFDRVAIREKLQYASPGWTKPYLSQGMTPTPPAGQKPRPSSSSLFNEKFAKRFLRSGGGGCGSSSSRSDRLRQRDGEDQESPLRRRRRRRRVQGGTGGEGQGTANCPARHGEGFIPARFDDDLNRIGSKRELHKSAVGGFLPVGSVDPSLVVRLSRHTVESCRAWGGPILV